MCPSSPARSPAPRPRAEQYRTEVRSGGVPALRLTGNRAHRQTTDHGVDAYRPSDHSTGSASKLADRTSRLVHGTGRAPVRKYPPDLRGSSRRRKYCSQGTYQAILSLWMWSAITLVRPVGSFRFGMLTLAGPLTGQVFAG
jgi:hypothetical protein